MESNPPFTKATPVNQAVSDVAKTIAEGELPSNEQLRRVIDHTSGLVESKKYEAPLDRTGKKIADEINTVLQDTRDLITEKNEGNRLQRIVELSKKAGEELAAEAKKEAGGLAVEAAQRATAQLPSPTQIAQSLQTSFSQMRDFSVEVVRSREFRSILIELVDLMQEGLQFTMEKTQQGLAKTQEGLQSAQESLEKGKEQASEKLSEAREKLESGEKVQLPEMPEMPHIGQQAQQLQQKASEALQQTKEIAQRSLEEARRGEIPSAVRELREKLPRMSSEQRQRLQSRLDGLLRRISRNEAWKRSLNSLFQLLDQLRQLSRSALERQERLAEEARTNPNLQEAWLEAQAMIESFAQGYSLERLKELLYNWMERMESDADLRSFWTDVRAYASDLLERGTGASGEEKAAREWEAKRGEQLRSLVDRAWELAQDPRYAEQTRELVGEFQRFLEALRSDPTSQKLVTDLRQLFQHLMVDDRGNLTFKQEELRQFKILITSLLMEELKYLPIPKLSGSTKEYDFWLSNVNLYAYDLLPEHIQVRFESNLDVNLKELEAERARTALLVRVTNMRTHMRNSAFYFKKKTGLIRLEDQGLVDVDLAGDGASLTVLLDFDASRKPVGWEVRRCSVDLDRLKIHIVDSRHDWLLNLFSGIVEHDVKRSIEREFERRIRDTLQEMFLDAHQLAKNLNDTLHLDKVTDVAKEQIKDVQATKNALEAAPHTKSTHIA
jgi:hypothetical protein